MGRIFLSSALSSLSGFRSALVLIFSTRVDEQVHQRVGDPRGFRAAVPESQYGGLRRHDKLGEMWLAAGALDEAADTLDRADHFLGACGQRYPEGLLLLLRARLLRARDEPVGVVRAAAEKARALSASHEAHLFVRQAEVFLAELGRPGEPVDPVLLSERVGRVTH